MQSVLDEVTSCRRSSRVSPKWDNLGQRFGLLMSIVRRDCDEYPSGVCDDELSYVVFSTRPARSLRFRRTAVYVPTEFR